MPADLAQNAVVAAVSTVLGVLISQGFGFAKSRSEAGDKASREREHIQSIRFDNLLKEFGAQTAKVEMMSGKIGKLEAKVEHLEQRNAELDTRATSLQAELTTEKASHIVTQGQLSNTRGQLTEALNSLAAVTEERDEIRLTLDEKTQIEKSHSSTANPT